MDDVCRQGIVERIDRRLAVIVAASLLLHAAGVLALKTVELPRGTEEVVMGPAPVFAPIVHATVNANVNVSVNANANVNANARRKRSGGRATVPRARLADEVRKLGALKTLTARGGEASEVRDLLARGSAPVDSDDALGRAAGISLGGAADSLRVRGDEVGCTRSGGSLRAGGPVEVETGERAAERGVAARIDLGPVAPPTGAPDAAVLAAAIRQRLGALRACWERSLRQRGDGAGKLVLRLDVGALGDVEEAVVEHDGVGDPQLVRCLRERVRGWRLPSVGKRFVFSFPVVLIAR